MNNEIRKEELYILINKIDTETLNELTEHLGNDYAEEDAFDVSGIIVIAVPIISIVAGSSVLKELIKGLFNKGKIELEYNGIKLKGSFDNVMKMWDKIKQSTSDDKD